MANTRVKLTFNYAPFTDPDGDDPDNITLRGHLPSLIPNPIEFSFLVFRDFAGSPSEEIVQSSSDMTVLANNYYSKLLSLYGDRYTASVLLNVVTIDITSRYDYMIMPYINYHLPTRKQFVTVELIDTQQVLTIDGLDSDRYLINNPVNVILKSDIPNNVYTVLVENLSNGRVANNLVVYAGVDINVLIDISPIIKGLFDYPKDAAEYIVNDLPTKNSNTFKITFGSSNTNTIELTRTFIRGGNRTNNTNQTINTDEICRPVLKLPIWQGFETADYYMHESGQVRKRLLAFVPTQDKDFRRTKQCNSVYVKFLNQKGGYCNWMFESFNESESNNSQGSFIRKNLVDDLGSESTNKIKVYSKVPEYYIDYMNDLIISPEVYVKLGGEYVRVTMGNNTITKDNIKRSFQVSLNINFEFRFNPSLLWSN